MKWLTSLLTVSIFLAHTSSARAGWFYDFDDGTIPETFTTEGFSESGPSPTFSASASCHMVSGSFLFLVLVVFFFPVFFEAEVVLAFFILDLGGLGLYLCRLLHVLQMTFSGLSSTTATTR